MRQATLTNAVPAAAVALSIALFAPVFAPVTFAGNGGHAEGREAQPAKNTDLQNDDPRARQVAVRETNPFVEVGHTQTVETKRLKRRPTKR